jgi:hypothetical protein
MLGDMLGGGKLLGKYGDDFAKFAKKYGDEILKYADDAVEYVYKYADDVLERIFKNGDEVTDLVKYSDEAGDVVKYGDEAGEAVVKTSDDVIHVTENGVALPTGDKYQIPDHYVENPHYPGHANYGEIVDGRYQERLRIDTPSSVQTNSHYHLNDGDAHFSPNPRSAGDPGFH